MPPDPAQPPTPPLEALLLQLQPGRPTVRDVQRVGALLGAQGCTLWASELRMCCTAAGAPDVAAKVRVGARVRVYACVYMCICMCVYM